MADALFHRQENLALAHHGAVADDGDVQNMLDTRAGGDLGFGAGDGGFGAGHEVAILGLDSEPMGGTRPDGIAIAERRPDLAGWFGG